MRGAWLVMKKEFLELLKDKRTLFFSFGMPLILYPALFGMMAKMHERDEAQRNSRPSRVYLMDPASVLAPAIKADSKDFQLVPAPEGDMKTALREKKLDMSIEVPADAVKALGDQRTFTLTVGVNTNEDDSTAAKDRLDTLLKTKNEDWVKGRLQALKAPADLVTPAKLNVQDASDEALEKAKLLGLLIPYIVLISMYGPIMGQGGGMTAGERERGTLMSLLSTRISRSQIALGKLLALFVLGVLGMTSNVLGIALSAGAFTGHSTTMGGNSQVSASLLQIASPATLGLIFLILLPVALVMVAFVLTVGIRAKTQREASLALMPGMIVIVILGVFSMSPGLEKMTFIHFIPILNASLSIREMFGPQFSPAHYALALVINTALAAVFTAMAAKTLNREDVIFKS